MPRSGRRLRLWPRRRLGWLWVALAAGILANMLRLRKRLAELKSLDPAGGEAVDAKTRRSDGAFWHPSTAGSGDAPVHQAAGNGGPAARPLVDDFVLARPGGVTVERATRALAASFARDEGLDVVDLVPGDLPYDQLLDLARAVDTSTYRTAPLAPGRGAGHAMLIRRKVWDRMTASAGAHALWAGAAAGGALGCPSGEVVVPDRAAMVALAEEAKLHAPRSTDLVVAPGLRAVEIGAPERVRQLDALYGGASQVAMAFPALRSLVLLAGMAVSPGWGAVAAAESLLQPYLVARGLSPTLLPTRGWPVGPLALLQAAQAAATNAAADDDPVESRRQGYAAELAQGTERFFEPRRTTCPWCSSTQLTTRIRTPDLTQFKPGEFVIDECTTCGLVFQNPRLTIDGLDFYYRDFYDGLGAGEADFLFSQSDPSYRGRVALAARHATPRTWLDVGTGYGHFCVVAAGLLPSTRFDGLDIGTSVEEARQRGWIANAYRGLFPDVADDIEGRYDLVSMHHYLEHTREPRAELEAAWTALAPGGHLLIEVPDPESRFARVLGRYWVPWLQPQHQQFLTVAHLRSGLEALGFTIVEVERGSVRQPVDVAGSFWLLFGHVAPWPRVPWRDPPTVAARIERWALLGAMAPLLALGLVADRVLQPLIADRAPAWSNAYRMLAQRPA